MRPEDRDEIFMLCRHVKQDDRFLQHIIEDYMRLKNYNEEGRVGAALEECRRLIYALRKKEEQSK